MFSNTHMDKIGNLFVKIGNSQVARMLELTKVESLLT
jgi:hypothetical protein